MRKGNKFEFAVVTPPALTDPTIAIAASRAGGIGILDLEYARDEKAALAAISRLALHSRQGCGIKLDPDNTLTPLLLSQVPADVHFFVLTRGDREALQQCIHLLHSSPLPLTIFLETTCLADAVLGTELGIDGLVAKGNESGGRVGEKTSFILLQELVAKSPLPVWVQGGIALHTAAACYAGGAAGVVLDAQVWLTRESALSNQVKNAIARMDGSETGCLGTELGEAYRTYHRVGLDAYDELAQLATSLAQQSATHSESRETWRSQVAARVGWGDPERAIWLLGQDAAFAAPLAERFRTVGGVLEAFREALNAHIHDAVALKPLGEHSPLARSHNTRYPIVQGPMTRVSDKAAFAAQVAQGGGLPFLALALMRAPEVEILLQETQAMLGAHPWGIGILGFVPFDLRQEQLQVVRRYKPAFALIAGGRPDQALALEKEGIPTYLHVPSPGLLNLFVENGARRFVFEGRECGGHVGPRTSFVLWNTMIDVLLDALPPKELQEGHVLFAGGIHDSLSASMVAAMATPLAARGVKIGVLLGTAYLFTHEAVTSGAIVEGFQKEALECGETILLETGPGHATRCARTPYTVTFQKERERLLAEGKDSEELRSVLEEMNLGRLRIASKGTRRHANPMRELNAPKFTTLTQDEQRGQGLYMIGQVAALRNAVCTIEEMHHDVSVAGSERLAHLTPAPGQSSIEVVPPPSQVAIIGMGCLLPKASNLQTYWENILNKVDAITEIPSERWDWRQYYDPDPRAHDKVYSRWGGFLEDVPFDPMRYGMPPNTLSSIEPLQLLTLEVVRAALEDAGYRERPFARQRTSVILGVGGGAGDLGQQYAVRAGLPMFVENPSPEVWTRLPEWTEESFAGILLNVAAGRVANRFDLGGINYTVDAACASSLAAVYAAIRELEAGTSEMVVVGGADTVQNPFGFLCFSKTMALSPTGRCRPFDEGANGIAISEGLAALILKRLPDAERDGDRIYAVIKSVAGSSDGRAKGLTAPRPEGQRLALERAYRQAGFSPATVGLIEAHGTGTVAGDQAEVETLKQVFDAAGAERASCAIGSVKSMIGHTKCTAGVASLIKVALALHHQVLPPTLNVAKPNPKAGFETSPFYVNTEPRPWIKAKAEEQRRAGASAFGFGGTNFHAVLEEYTGNFLPTPPESLTSSWQSELLIWVGASRQELRAQLEQVAQALTLGAQPALCDLALTLWRRARGSTGPALAMIVSSPDDLTQKLALAIDALNTKEKRIHHPKGIYFSEEPLAKQGKLAFLFPGQGSQSRNMLCDLALYFHEVREAFERANSVLATHLPKPLSSYIFPPPAFSAEAEQAQTELLTRTDIAQPALGAASLGVFRLLQVLGVHPALAAGHSYGEYTALCSAGVIGEETLYELSEARGRCIIESGSQDLGTMAAVGAGSERVAEFVKSLDEVWIANVNTPQQTVIAGTRQGIAHAMERLSQNGIQTRTIPVACAFHSPIIAPAKDRLSRVLATIQYHAPQIPVFANSTAAPYPIEPDGIRECLSEHLVTPVRFSDEINAMYDSGARIFIEVGPRNVLTGLVHQTLGNQDHLAVSLDAPGRPGLVQLAHALGQLVAEGVPVNLDRLLETRRARELNLARLVEETRTVPLPLTTWLVNGGKARPVRSPVIASPEQAGSTEGSRAASGNGKVADYPPLPEVNGQVSETGSAGGRDNGQSSAGVTHAETIPALHTAKQDVALGSTEQSPAAPPAPVTAPEGLSDRARVMVQFQQVMDRFLETQQQVMLAFLQGEANREEARSGKGRAYAGPIISAVPHVFPKPTALESGAGSGEAPAPNGIHTALPPQPTTLAAVPSATREQITDRLVKIVCDRTGYPAEMLDLDLNVEADLGIASIMRVEILGLFYRTCLPSEQEKIQQAMEQLTALKTLRGIVEGILQVLQASGREPSNNGHSPDPIAVSEAGHDGEESNPAPSAPPVVSTRASEIEPVSRFRLKAVDRPLPPGARANLQGKLFLITDDERGLAKTLSEALERAGGRAVRVRHLTSSRNDNAAQAVNLTSPTAVTEFLETLRRERGPLAGIIHLLPFQAGPAFQDMDVTAWQERLDLEVKSLFLLAQAARTDLNPDKESELRWLIAVTAMGGTFASDDAQPQAFLPSQGGVTGLLKTLALEWQRVRVKTIDFDASAAFTECTAQLLAEMAAEDGQVEVGYVGARRIVLKPTPAPLPSTNHQTPMRIDSNSVVLVIGGARGITAEISCELAARYQPSLLLVGRSPLPDADEPHETAALTGKELKAALIEKQRQSGPAVTVAQVEAQYTRLLNAREMRRSIDTIERAGARVWYYQCDVRDERAFGALLDRLYAVHGRIDGVVHGAGVIEDKLLSDKGVESFDRVFDTKTLSAFTLSRKLHPESLHFLVFFSSVAGRFGNRGQSDYSAANEVLNKLALYLDRQWQCRVAAVNWGPWRRAGMVSAEVERQFAERGVELLSPDAGRRFFDEELQSGAKGEVEIIAGDGPWRTPAAVSTAARVLKESADVGNSHPLPLLHNVLFRGDDQDAMEFVLTLNPQDAYLQDHRLDAKPVFPMAMAMELFAEVGRQLSPGLDLVGIHSMQVLRGIMLGDQPHPIKVKVHPKQIHSGDGAIASFEAEIIELDAGALPSYRAVVQLGARPGPPSFGTAEFSDSRPFPMSVQECYQRWLFQGSSLQGIESVKGISERGISAILLPSVPSNCMQVKAGSRWTLDPVLLDCSFQLAILWERAMHEMTPLPSGFKAYHAYSAPSSLPVTCLLGARSSVGGHSLVTHITFLDSSGQVIADMVEMEFACSKALNRLAGARSAALDSIGSRPVNDPSTWATAPSLAGASDSRGAR